MATRQITETVTCAYIADVLMLQSEMLRRLSRGEAMELAQLGAVMEEIGTLYLGLSEAIRHSAQHASHTAMSDPAPVGQASPWIDGVWRAKEHYGKLSQN